MKIHKLTIAVLTVLGLFLSLTAPLIFLVAFRQTDTRLVAFCLLLGLLALTTGLGLIIAARDEAIALARRSS